MAHYAAIAPTEKQVSLDGDDHVGKAARADLLCRPLEGSRASAFALITFGAAIGLSPMVMFGPVLPVVRAKLGLGHVEAGFLMACPMLSGSTLRLVAGPLADAMDQRFLMTGLLVLSTLGTLGVATVMESLGDAAEAPPGAFLGLASLGVLAGCGVATFPVGVTQLSYWCPLRSQGSALGLYGGLAGLSPAVMTYLLPRSMARLGLFRSYAIWFLAMSAGTVVYCTFVRNAWIFQLQDRGLPPDTAHVLAAEHGQEAFPSRSRDAAQSVRTAAGVWQTWALVFVYIIGFGGQVALTGWFPSFWHEAGGMDLGDAGGLTAVYGLTSALVRCLIGPVADRIGGAVVVAVGMVVASVGAWLIVLSADFYAELAGQELIGVGFGMINGAVFKMVPHQVPEAVGGASGLVAGLGSFGGFALPSLLACFPRSMGTPGYARSFVVIPALAPVGLLMACALWRAEGQRPGADGDFTETDDASTTTSASEEGLSIESLVAPVLGC